MVKKRAPGVRVATALPPPARAPRIRALPAGSAAFVYADAAIDSISVFLIEDSRLLRDGITAMLGDHGITVTATARTAKDALRQVGQLRGHVVLVDAAMKDVDSLALVAAVRAAGKDVRVVVMDLLPTQQDVSDFVHAGVAGFILKDATEEVFVGTIRAVAGGTHVLPIPLPGAFLAQVAADVQARGPRVVKSAVRMTAREHAVVAMIARGATNKEIGARLQLTAYTVKSHVSSIMEKLALHTRLEVAPSRR